MYVVHTHQQHVNMAVDFVFRLKWQVTFILVLTMLPSVALDLQSSTRNHARTKSGSHGARGVDASLQDTKLALASLDKVLENSRLLREQLREILLKRTSNTQQQIKDIQETELKASASKTLSSPHLSPREQLKHDLDKELKNQATKHTSEMLKKTALEEAVSVQSLRRDETIHIPPPPWKIKAHVPPPPDQIKSSAAETPKHPIPKRRQFSMSDRQNSATSQIVIPPQPDQLDENVDQVNKREDASQDKGKQIWSRWTSFSQCHRDLSGNCNQRRQRLCQIKDPNLCLGANKYGIEVQYRECDSKKCENRGKQACVNKEDHFKCRFWAQAGKCDEQPDQMWASCCKACRDCVDKDTDCAKRAAIGDCKLNEKYMVKRCAASCGICEKL